MYKKHVTYEIDSTMRAIRLPIGSEKLSLSSEDPFYYAIVEGKDLPMCDENLSESGLHEMMTIIHIDDSFISLFLVLRAPDSASTSFHVDILAKIQRPQTKFADVRRVYKLRLWVLVNALSLLLYVCHSQCVLCMWCSTLTNIVDIATRMMETT